MNEQSVKVAFPPSVAERYIREYAKRRGVDVDIDGLTLWTYAATPFYSGEVTFFPEGWTKYNPVLLHADTTLSGCYNVHVHEDDEVVIINHVRDEDDGEDEHC